MFALKSMLVLPTLLLAAVPALADVTLITSSGTECQNGIGFPKVLFTNECVGIDDAFSSLAIASAGSFELNNPKCTLRFYKNTCGDAADKAGNYTEIRPIKQAVGLCIVPLGGKTVPANAVAAKLTCPKA